jgi:hypothetical protein
LRQQLAAYKQTGTRPTLHASDRLFWSDCRACGLPAACLASRMPGLTAPCHAGLAIQRRLSVAPPVVTTSVSADKTGSPGTLPQYCPSFLHRTCSCIRPRARHGLRGRARSLRHGRPMGLCGSNERRDIFHTRLRILVLRPMPCLWKHDQLHRRKFPGQSVPIFHRKYEVVVSGNHQGGVHTRFGQKLSLTYDTHNCLADSLVLFCV